MMIPRKIDDETMRASIQDPQRQEFRANIHIAYRIMTQKSGKTVDRQHIRQHDVNNSKVYGKWEVRRTHLVISPDGILRVQIGRVRRVSVCRDHPIITRKKRSMAFRQSHIRTRRGPKIMKEGIMVQVQE